MKNRGLKRVCRLLRGLLPVFLLALPLLPVHAAAALEVSVDSVVPFGRNTIVVRSDVPGILTVTPALPDFDLMPAVSAFPVEAGSTEIPWDGLSWFGEPLPAGRMTLKACLVDASGDVAEASVRISVSAPLCAAVSCLPAADSFCPEAESLRVECGMSRKGSVRLEIASADAPDKVLRTLQGKAKDNVPVSLKWDGKDQKHRKLPAGEYILTAYSEALPDRRVTASVSLLSSPAPVPAVFETGDILPSDPENDEEVWAALTAPAVVGAGTEGQGLYLMKKKKYSPGGSISARTAAVRVLEVGSDGWCKVAAWRQAVGEYMEGWVQAEKLAVIPPRQHYGVLINKANHIMTVYEDGKRIGSMQISTGLLNGQNLLAATPPGVYLLGSRMKDFQREGFHYDYPIRLHGDYLLHTVGYKTKESVRYYTQELEDLGGAASHGCVRMDVRVEGEDSLNAWWIWTHLGRDTRVIVTEGK